MADPNLFNDTRALWYVTPGTVGERSIGALIDTLKAKAPNVNALYVKCWNWHGWAYRAVANKPGMAITGEADVKRWADALHAAGMRMVAWGVARGTSTKAEADIMRRVAGAGVDALVVDVEAGEYYWSGTDKAADDLAQVARSTGVHVGLCYDYRGTHPITSRASRWYPYVDSLHPMAYHFHFGRSASVVMAECVAKLRPLGKPIVPALQGYSVGTRLYNPDDIPTTATIAKSHGVAGLSWFRYGAGMHLPESGIGPNDLWAVAKVGGGASPKPVEPALFSYTDKAGGVVDVLSIDGGKWRTRHGGTVAPVALRAS